LESKPCRYKPCPAIAKPSSAFGYCPIHDKIASEFALFEEALKGRAGAALKKFAQEVQIGVYPRKNW
jgi:hypothetical protein